MKILVTGGAGFLGSHLVDRLLKDGHNITVLDDLSTGSLENIPHVEKVRLWEINVKHGIPEKFDQIYNLACPASPVAYQRQPIETLMTNIIGMDCALRNAQAHGGRVLQASTSEIYGDPTQHPQAESYWGNVNPNGPRACYDEGKRAAETLCYDYHRQYNVDVRVARIFNTYGPRMAVDDGRVVSNFIVQALLGKPLTIYGNGRQTRSFCYVADLIDGLVKLMNSNVTEPVNLGNPKEFTMLELAVAVKTLTGSKSEIAFRPLPTDDPTRRRPSIMKAMDELKWSPRVDLEDGLKTTIEYFKGIVK